MKKKVTKKKIVKKCKSDDVRIVILQRGWVLVGKFSQAKEKCSLNGASVIRTWGTSKGLGEIAEGGPTASTKLDKIPEVNFHELTVIATIKCEANKWQSYL